MAVLFVFGCGHVNTKKSPVSNTSAKQAIPFKTPDSLNIEPEENAEANTADSLQLVSAMGEILKYAYQHKNEKCYTTDLKLPGYPRISVKLTFGNLFDGAKKHLVVRRAASGEITNIDIFLLGNNGFKRVCTDTLIDPSYIGDTIRDVNGDHQKDFLVHWYPPSGCCDRDVYDVYVYRPGNGRFSKSYKFINPVFSPSEKTIRGFTYGQHPALYKYRWDGLKVDTLEFIVVDTALKKFRVFKHEDDADNFLDPEADNKKPGKIIAKIPEEFENDFDWFGK